MTPHSSSSPRTTSRVSRDERPMREISKGYEVHLKRRGVVRLPYIAIPKLEVDLRGVEVRVA